MLLLTRKQNESLIIEVEGLDSPIEIKIIDINNQVRLGISAPDKCKIWREELFQTIQVNRQSLEEVDTDSVKKIMKNLSNGK